MATGIGVHGVGKEESDGTIVPGECELCHGQTWPMDGDCWQCEDCGEIYAD